MNLELVKQLKHTASKEVFDYNGSNARPGEMYSNYKTVIDYEKFVELIVRQCVEQCYTVSELKYKGFVVSECAKRIEKHFSIY